MYEASGTSKMRGRNEKRTQNFTEKLEKTDYLGAEGKWGDYIKTHLT